MSDPTRAVTPTLDGPVLAVLALSVRPLTVGQVATQAVRGSEIGVRRALARLVEQGIVRATEVGRSRVYELNRNHLAAPIALSLAGLRLGLWRQLREALAKWKVRPVYACAFGSAARGDGGVESDIDVLLVHPPFPGDKRLARSSVRELFGNVALDLTLPVTTEAHATKWGRQIGDLHQLVRSWTGNPLQVLDISAFEWASQRRGSGVLFKEISADAVVLVEQAALAEIGSRVV